jgi:hypothetical protein
VHQAKQSPALASGRCELPLLPSLSGAGRVVGWDASSCCESLSLSSALKRLCDLFAALAAALVTAREMLPDWL